MTADTMLIEKREELKRRLAAGEYKTLVDVFLEWFDRLIRKITRRSNPLPLWLVTVILCVVLELITNTGIYIAGDWAVYRKISESFGLGFAIGYLINLLNGILFIMITIVLNQFIRRLFMLWRDDILDKTESLISLSEFEDWLRKTCNWRLHLLVIMIPNLILSPLGFYLMRDLFSIHIGYGLFFSILVLNIFSMSLLFQLLMIMLLSVRLHRYDLKLFAANPGSSELISRLSGEFGFCVYYVAIFAAIVTLGISAIGLFASLGIVMVLYLWLPIITLFILNQTSLSSIIRRAKWKTLNEIQAKVEKLQTSKNFGNQETMDAIKRLMDYHDRVKSTHDSALDFRTYLGFINSLLLPLLAFILGNLDLVLNLFARQP